MRGQARHRLAQLLSDSGVEDRFSARRSAPVGDLALEVRGVGRLQLPVPDDQAAQLARIGQPARYGKGVETLLDPTVRDTGEIPRSQVTIDQRRWNRTLLAVVDRLGQDLGLPEGAGLRPELYSMLVYGPGQFFVPHQDSEKADDMVASLVVTLPSAFTGGSLVVEHHGKRATYRSTKTSLSFVAFYSDCRHEIRPVTSGHRIVLTYNLHLRNAPVATTTAGPPSATVEAVARYLEEHFTTPADLPPWRRERPAGEPPNRLVYLLDHEYTQRGLSWSRLKGDDANRATIVRAAAAGVGCEVVLALADVHQVWSCLEPDWGRRPYRSSGPGHRDAYGSSSVDWDDYDLEDLIDWTVTLDHWVPPAGRSALPINTVVGDHEVCESTPSVGLTPYDTEFQGYTGNAGNTMDRWYHRGALVLWPRDRAFAVRAEAAPAQALDELADDLRRGERSRAREDAATLAPFWADVARGQHPASFFPTALGVARALDVPELASMLLAPFTLTQLEPAHARALLALDQAYGSTWTGQLIAAWSTPKHRMVLPAAEQHAAWITTLDQICDRLVAIDGTAGQPLGALLAKDAWEWLQPAISYSLGLKSPSQLVEALDELGPAVTAVLNCTTIIGDTNLRDQMIAALEQENDDLLPCLASLLYAADTLDPATREAAGLHHLARHSATRLRARLALPARAEGDWSMPLPAGWHNCPLCETLAQFLTDPDGTTIDWPLKQDSRGHIHSTIDHYELPVRHQTRHTGSPYILVLTKTDALFVREQQQRSRDVADLAAIEAMLP